MKPSRYFTAGIYIGAVGALGCLVGSFVTSNTDWLIMQLFFTCIYLNSYHCRKAAEVEHRLAELELALTYKCRPIVISESDDTLFFRG